MKVLHVTMGGPTVRQLRLSVGDIDRPVTFGTGNKAVTVFVAMLCDASGYDLPINLPCAATTHRESVWLLAGEVKDDPEGDDLNVIILYSAAHRSRTAIILKDRNSANTADLNMYFPLRDRFMKALQEVQAEN